MKDAELLQAFKKFIDSVEKYVQPKKGEFLSRNELLVDLRKIKRIINESKH